MPSGTRISRNYSIAGEIYSCRFSPNNTYAVGDDDGKVHYYHANYTVSWVYTYTWGGGAPSVAGVVFTPDGSVLATVWAKADGKVVYIFGNLSNGTNATLVSSPGVELKSLHYSYDG